MQVPNKCMFEVASGSLDAHGPIGIPTERSSAGVGLAIRAVDFPGTDISHTPRLCWFFKVSSHNQEFNGEAQMAGDGILQICAIAERHLRYSYPREQG